MNRFGPGIAAAPIAAIVFLALSGLGATALAQDENELPPADDPPLADTGWTVPYNDLLVACYQGSMNACDRVASDRGMISGNFVYDYATTCGGRMDRVTARRLSARMLENGIRGGTCSNVFSPE